MAEKKQNLFSLLIALSSFVFFNSCAWWERQKEKSVTHLFSEECTASQAPFIVSQIEKSPNNEAVSITHGRDGLIKTFSLNLKACMRDYIRKDNPIQNIPFVIEYYGSEEDKQNGKLSKATAISNIHGCIQWQEIYNYKYTVKPLWIGLERTIKKEKGAYAGAEPIPMAVNPWLSDRDRKAGLPFILDTRCEYSKNHHILAESQNYEPEGLKYLSETKKNERPLLWVPDIYVQIHEINPNKNAENREDTEEGLRHLLSRYQKPCINNKPLDNKLSCYERQVEMILYIPLKFRTLDRIGLRKDDLLGGAYDIETELVVSPKEDGNNYRLHQEVCYNKNISLNQTNRSLSLTCRLSFSYFNQNVLSKVAIRIKPSSPDLPFKKFEGVYSIKLNFQDEKLEPTVDTVYDEVYEAVLTADEELKIIENMNIRSVYSLLKSAESVESSEKAKEGELVIGEKGPVQGLSFYPLHLDGYGEYKLSHVTSGGSKCSERENVVERTAVFVGKLCLKDILQSQELSNTPFRVFLEKPIEGTIEEIYFSGKNGKKQLFKTDGRSCISVPIDIKHKLYNRQKYFQVDMHVLSEDLNLYGKVRLALSPWQRAFQAFQDAQNLNENVIRFDTYGIPKPQLIINQFRSINLFPSYGLDKLLNIHLFHRIYLLFQPFIRRPDNLSLGLDYRARELLRDGYYLVRVLVLRNPQETGNTDIWARVKTTEELNQSRQNNVTEDQISLRGAKYITHTDSVVKAKANFINFYMPLYLSTKQFYYIASRNFIVIEIHPADPSLFRYKDSNCSVDTQKTIWKPYWNHELENAPYVGAINIQRWVNWNLLQRVKDFNTDQIIDQSEIGKKYKHFNFSKEEQPSNQNISVSEGCVNEILKSDKGIMEVEKNLSQYGDGQIINSFNPSKEDEKKCAKQQNIELSSGLETYKQSEEKRFNSNILENFSKENSLKIVNLGAEGSQFVQNIQESFGRYKQIKKIADIGLLNQALFLLPAMGGAGISPLLGQQNIWELNELLSFLPQEDRELLRLRIKRVCRREEKCSQEIIKAYLINIQKSLSVKSSALELAVDLIHDNQLISEEDEETLNQSVKSCENTIQCLNNAKAYLLNVLGSSISRLSFYEQNLFLENLMRFLSREQKRHLFERIKQQCSTGFWKGLWNFSETYNQEYAKCYYKEVKLFYEENHFVELSDIQDHASQVAQGLNNDALLRRLNVLPDTKEGTALKSIMSAPTQTSLSDLIETGIKGDNKYSSDILSFTKSMCFFWFDHFLKDYLDEDQMINVYANYISKFDYHQILDTTYSYSDQVVSLYPDIIKYLKASDNGESAKCYDDYTQCVLADHCQERTTNQSKKAFCSQVNPQDKTCVHLLKEECQKDPSLSLCSNECLFNPQSAGCGNQNFCNREVRNFCLTNGDQEICNKYDKRCTANYTPCLKKMTTIFNVKQVLNYDGKDVNFEPLRTCLNDPYDFFQFENKMIVHELSQNRNKYAGGFLQSFNVAANYSIGSYMNWTAQRGRSISASSDVSSSPKIPIIGMTLGKLGLSQSISSNESNSNRRAVDNRTGESVYLTVANAKIQIGVKKFQNCLTVKPRANAFTAKPEEGEMKPYKKVWTKSANALKKTIVSRSGLILCNPIEDREGKDPEYITETYYYISQHMNDENSQFLNLYDLANRPFILVLRGRQEFVKLYHLLKLTIEGDNGVIEENGGLNRSPENMFIEYPFPVEEAGGMSLTIREFKETGFSPGIYHYPYNSDDNLNIWFANRDKKNWWMDVLTEHNLFGIPANTNRSIPIQQ